MKPKSLFLLLLTYLVFLAANVSSEDLHRQDSKLEIGVLLCLTGNCADWGTAALNGAKLAASEINNAGGVLGRKLVLKVEDTRESISGFQAVSAFKKLVDADGLHFIIGPSWSPGALAIAPIAAARKDLLIITPSASAEAFNEAAQHIFNMRPAERVATVSLAKFAFRKGWKKAAVFTSQQPAEMTQGRIFADQFREIGGEVVKYVETNPEATDLRSEALEIKASNPDVIFLMAYNQMNSAIGSLRKIGYKGPLLAISIDEQRIAASNGLLEEAYVAKALPPGDKFSARYKHVYKEPPGLSAENGYDAILAIAKGIEEAKSTNAGVVARAVQNIEMDGAAGKVKFDPKGAVHQEPALYIVKGNSLEPVERQ